MRPPAVPARAALPFAVRLLLAALVGAAVLLADRLEDRLPELRRLELLSVDWRFRLRGPRAPGPDVALVAIDDRTAASLDRWPPPRDVIAAAIGLAVEEGARLVVLDLLLVDPAPSLAPDTRDELAALVAGLPPGDLRLRAELDRLLARDAADGELAATVAGTGRVALPYAFVFDPRATGTTAAPAIAATAYAAYARPPGTVTPDLGARGLLAPDQRLAAGAAGLGHVTLVEDDDGTARFDLPAFPYAGDYYPSLAVEAARLRLGLRRDQLALRLGESLALGEDRRLPLDDRSRLLLDHYGPEGSFPTVSLRDLLDRAVAPGLLAGKVAVIGATAAATGDRFQTPFTSRLPGAELIATAIDNILHARALRRDVPVRAADAAAILAMALAAALLAGRRSLPLSLAAVALLAAGWAGATVLAFVRAGTWLALVAPTAAAVLAGGAAEVLRASAAQRERRRLGRQRANLARYFPPSVVDRLAASDRPSGLERTQEAAVMFVDMVGFTRVTEGLAPAEAMGLLRAFHRLVERAVFAHGGMVDKFIGDGALACFGVPDPTARAAADALRAAKALLAAVEGLSREAEAVGRPPVRVGIGIHLGPVLMGDIGGERQFQFTVVGDTVNVASRLEALTRQAGTSLIVSGAAVERAAAAGGDADLLAGLEPMPDQPIRGREGRIAAWRLVPGE